MMILLPALFAVMFLGMQAALFYHARTVAIAAAQEGAKAASVGLDADYLNTYTASLSYTNFFDGKYNTQGDRDFLALSFGVNF